MNRKTLSILSLLLFVIAYATGVVAIIYFSLFYNSTTEAGGDYGRVKVFNSREECEDKTDKSCIFKTCDFILPGETFDEVCGKDFRKGWAPVLN